MFAIGWLHIAYTQAAVQRKRWRKGALWLRLRLNIQIIDTVNVEKIRFDVTSARLVFNNLNCPITLRKYKLQKFSILVHCMCGLCVCTGRFGIPCRRPWASMKKPFKTNTDNGQSAHLPCFMDSISGPCFMDFYFLLRAHLNSAFDSFVHFVFSLFFFQSSSSSFSLLCCVCVCARVDRRWSRPPNCAGVCKYSRIPVSNELYFFSFNEMDAIVPFSFDGARLTFVCVRACVCECL